MPICPAYPRYNKFGLDGLKDLEHPPKKTILTSDELTIIDEILKKSPYDAGLNYNNCTGKLLVKWIGLNFNKTRAKKLSSKINKETLTNFRE